MRDTWNLEELLKAGSVDVDAGFRGGQSPRVGFGLRGLKGETFIGR